uniref:T9SS type A sorting domain-containing protein n=1 Tax=Rhodothermus marinus TaxID=29549 RepID=UPI000AC4202C
RHASGVDAGGGGGRGAGVDTTGVLHVAGGQVLGTVVNRGELEADTALMFGNGAVYEHARNGGSIPTGNWEEGSTVLLTGIVDEAPANRNQSYYHVVFNTPNQTKNLHMSFDEVTIGGDIRVISTGVARWYLASASAQDTSVVTIMGDVIVEDGQFSTHGTGNANTTFVVHHYGNIRVTGGNFSISRGSQGGGTGTTTWILYEGDFEMSNATTQNSNPTPGNAKFVFAKAGVQRLVLGEGNDIRALPIEVAEGTTLDMGTSELGGDDIFILNGGATLATAHPGGVAGSIQTLGTVALDTTANFVFNGTEHQETSTLMPTVVNDLVIDNAAGVKLSQETRIDGVLRLKAGVLDNTIPFTLGPNGSISYEGGSLLHPVANEPSPDVPTRFALYDGYPNPFRQVTTIRYDVAAPRRVVIKVYDLMGREVAELVNRDHQPGTYTVQWRPRGLASGLYYCRIDAGAFQAVRTLVLMK